MCRMTLKEGQGKGMWDKNFYPRKSACAHVKTKVCTNLMIITINPKISSICMYATDLFITKTFQFNIHFCPGLPNYTNSTKCIHTKKPRATNKWTICLDSKWRCHSIADVCLCMYGGHFFFLKPLFMSCERIMYMFLLCFCFNKLRIDK